MSYAVLTCIAMLASTPATSSRVPSREPCRSKRSTKFESAINRKTAKALGLAIPVVLRVFADLID
jgi:hypothetical protein